MAGSPPTGLPLKSRLVDDGPVSGSPDKEKAPAANPNNPRAVGPGWRRPGEWGPNGEAKEGAEGWRPGQRTVSHLLPILEIL